MRFQARILFIALVVLIGCDKPLTLQPEDNISAIKLEVNYDGEEAILSWSKIAHSGFSRYIVLHVDSSETIFSDTTDIVLSHVLFSTSDPDSVSFVDNIPNLGEGNYYKVFAEVGGRLVGSNAVKSRKQSAIFPGIRQSAFLITGSDDALFFVGRDLINGDSKLWRYDLNTNSISAELSITFINTNAEITYGDFGSGSPEIAFYNGFSKIDFLDPVSLELNHSEGFFSIPESMLWLSNNRLTVLYGSSSSLIQFDRGNNRWSPNFIIGNTISSTLNMVTEVPGKNELIVGISVGRLFRIAFDESGTFTRIGFKEHPGTIISEIPFMDPQGKYLLASNRGHIFDTESLEIVYNLKIDSVSVFNRAFGMNSSGNAFAIVSSFNPSRMATYDRDDLKQGYNFQLSQDILVERAVRIGSNSYLMIRRNTNPRLTILATIPN
ncbi:MAG: hypothetical protein AB8F95_19820 [Bacteroidia bacterium]